MTAGMLTMAGDVAVSQAKYDLERGGWYDELAAVSKRSRGFASALKGQNLRHRVAKMGSLVNRCANSGRAA